VQRTIRMRQIELAIRQRAQQLQQQAKRQQAQQQGAQRQSQQQQQQQAQQQPARQGPGYGPQLPGQSHARRRKSSVARGMARPAFLLQVRAVEGAACCACCASFAWRACVVAQL
jgi:hypothetical protein